MPVYKQYRYYKIRDCPGCRYYKFDECHHPLPNDFNCHFITQKEFQHRYFFKTSINGRSFIRRGYMTAEAARDAETDFRREILGKHSSFLLRSLPTYRKLLNLYAEDLKHYKDTYYVQQKRKIQNFYSSLFP